MFYVCWSHFVWRFAIGRIIVYIKRTYVPLSVHRRIMRCIITYTLKGTKYQYTHTHTRRISQYKMCHLYVFNGLVCRCLSTIFVVFIDNSSYRAFYFIIGHFWKPSFMGMSNFYRQGAHFIKHILHALIDLYVMMWHTKCINFFSFFD